jgi:hypothetical protein
MANKLGHHHLEHQIEHLDHEEQGEHADHGPAPEHHHARRHAPSWMSLALALMLGAAAMASGFIAWRAAVHSGAATKAYTQTELDLNNTNTLRQELQQAIINQRDLFVSYETAVGNGQSSIATEIKNLMDPSTLATVNWWLAQPVGLRPPSPFSAANPDWVVPTLSIEVLDATATTTSTQDSADANLERSHQLELLEALLAIAFLTGGLTSTLEHHRAKAILLTTSTIVLVMATVGLVVLW